MIETNQNHKERKKRVRIVTFGCSHNVADSETMASYLSNQGFEVLGFDKKNSSGETEGEDLIIYNTCTVKNPTDDKFFSLLKKQSNSKKPIVIAGCIPQSEKDSQWLKKYSAIGIDQLDSVTEVVKSTLDGNIIHRLDKKTGPYSRDFIPQLRKNSNIIIIPILTGCLGNCTYCRTKLSRGSLRSVRKESVLSQIRLAKSEGVKEVWLVSEDNGAYGLDIGSSLPELLKSIAEIEGDFKVRIGMLNPDFAFKYKTELSEILRSDRFFTFLHIPIQSADNSVLKDMNRMYTIEEFEDAVNVIRSKNPNLNLATDIICGFPTETLEQWNSTMEFIKRFNFDIINISKFYPRPGTPAERMKQIPTKEIKRRSKELTEWFDNNTLNEKFVGRIINVLIDEVGKSEGTFIGRSESYKPVVVKSDRNIIGEFLNVKILSYTQHYLVGEIIGDESKRVLDDNKL